MKSALVKAHRAGLFSLLNNVITCLDIYDRIQVDWTGSIYGDGNLWDALFDPTGDVPEPFDVINNYPSQWLTYKHAAKLYEGGHEWREKCSFYWNQFFVHPDIEQAVYGFMVERDLQDYISVIVRAHGHAGEQPSCRSQSLDAYAAAIDDRLGPATRLFVMAGDNQTVEWLKARFPVTYFEDTPRMQDRNSDRHLNVPQTFADARRVLIEVMVASRGRALIHPVSNMATAALYIEPEIQSIYLP